MNHSKHNIEALATLSAATQEKVVKADLHTTCPQIKNLIVAPLQFIIFLRPCKIVKHYRYCFTMMK